MTEDTPPRPCRDCERHNLDADTCNDRPKCLTHRHRLHLEQWGVCDDCQNTIAAQLRALPDLAAQAHHHLLPGFTEHAITGVPGSRPPLDIAALDLACAEWLLMTDEDTDDPPWTGLEGWEQDWRRTLHLSPYGPASAHRTALGQTTLVGVVGFLVANLPRAAVLHPAIDEFARDVRRMHQAALGTLRIAEPAPWTIACPTDECGRRLRVEHDGREALVRCPACRVERTVENLLYLARADGRPCWVDAPTAAWSLGIDVAHLGPMVRDGRLRSRGDRDCRQYDVNSVRDTPTAQVLA